DEDSAWWASSFADPDRSPCGLAGTALGNGDLLHGSDQARDGDGGVDDARRGMQQGRGVGGGGRPLGADQGAARLESGAAARRAGPRDRAPARGRRGAPESDRRDVEVAAGGYRLADRRERPGREGGRRGRDERLG